MHIRKRTTKDTSRITTTRDPRSHPARPIAPLSATDYRRIVAELLG